MPRSLCKLSHNLLEWERRNHGQQKEPGIEIDEEDEMDDAKDES